MDLFHLNTPPEAMYNHNIQIVQSVHHHQNPSPFSRRYDKNHPRSNHYPEPLFLLFVKGSYLQTLTLDYIPSGVRIGCLHTDQPYIQKNKTLPF